MSKGGSTQTTVQKSDPWSAAQPALKNILGQAQSLYNQGGSYYPFSTVVPFSQQTIQGLQNIQDRAGQPNPIVGQSQSALSSLLSGNSNLQATANGDFLNNNPYLSGMFNAAKGDVIDAVNSQFSQANRTGSPAQYDYLTKQLGNLASNIYGQNYAQERQNQLSAASTLGQQSLSALGLSPTVNDLGYADASKLLGVGATYEQNAQQQLQDLMNRWDFSQNQPWQNIAKWAQVVNPIAGSGGAQTTTSPNNAPSGLQQGIGSALAIASLFA